MSFGPYMVFIIPPQADTPALQIKVEEIYDLGTYMHAMSKDHPDCLIVCNGLNGGVMEARYPGAMRHAKNIQIIDFYQPDSPKE